MDTICSSHTSLYREFLSTRPTRLGEPPPVSLLLWSRGGLVIGLWNWTDSQLLRAVHYSTVHGNELTVSWSGQYTIVQSMELNWQSAVQGSILQYSPWNWTDSQLLRAVHYSTVHGNELTVSWSGQYTIVQSRELNWQSALQGSTLQYSQWNWTDHQLFREVHYSTVYRTELTASCSGQYNTVPSM